MNSHSGAAKADIQEKLHAHKSGDMCLCYIKAFCLRKTNSIFKYDIKLERSKSKQSFA